MNYLKYPKTPHLPWSPGVSRDDKVLESARHFVGRHIVATIKMDGENTTMYRDYIHARSIDSRDHPSRHWVKNLHRNVCFLIPEGWRICGENLYAKHSIHYENLLSYFLVFSIWNDRNHCLPWHETVSFCEEYGLTTVPVMFEGLLISEDLVQSELTKAFKPYKDEDEGYVVRLHSSFHYDLFGKSAAKYVREAHVQTDGHWMHREIVRNSLHNRKV